MPNDLVVLLVATEPHYEPLWGVMKAVKRVAARKLPNGLSQVPDGGLWRVFSVQKYGMMSFGDLFAAWAKRLSGG